MFFNAEALSPLILLCDFQPSLGPTVVPSQSPTQSAHPSHLPSNPPTEDKIVESSIIIDQSSRRSSTELLIVGACCLVFIASTSAYLYKRGSGGHKRKRPPAKIEVSSPKHSDGPMISPYSIENNLNLGHHTFDINYGESGSRMPSSDDYEYYAAKKKRLQNDGGLVGVDLETGRFDINHVPNSVSIINMTKESNANMILPCKTDDPETPGSTRLRMPKSIYVPKFFQRAKEGVENVKQPISWNQIRAEDRSPASSGFAPASVPSPFLKGMSSLYAGIGKSVSFNETSNSEVDGDITVSTNEKSSDKISTRKGWKRRVITSPSKDVAMKKDDRSLGSDVFADLDNTDAHNDVRERARGRMCLTTAVSRSSEGSSVEWGIDVPKVQGAFETNMAELQNILTSINSMGSTSPRPEVQLTYTDDSWEDENYIGEIAPLGSSSTHSSNVQSFHSPAQKGMSKSQNGSGITYERELLNANQTNCEGISFRNIFNDPKNDLYECHVPSGPLGIVVDTTSLGPRVRSLNPLSPLFGKICPGDVVVGVDDVDTVGMEAGAFWQIVSRKANQQQRVLTVLRI